MNKIKMIVFAFSIFLMGCISVEANTTNSIKIDGIIDENGNIHFVEVWDMDTNKNTEIYKKEYDLGNVVIENYKVRDESRDYTLNNNWNVKGNFNSKRFRYGINNTSEGKELCWGISEYGHKIYTIEYDKMYSIFNTSDAQILYIRLIDDSEFPAERFEINIRGPEPFEDTLDVWGYGHKGYTYVNNGIISLSNEENTPLESDNYVVLLVKFPLNTFNISEDNRYSQFNTFDDVLNEAENGKFNYNYGNSFIEMIIGNIGNIIIFLIFGTVVFRTAKGGNKYKFGPAGRSIKMSDINAFRDIPCNKDIFRAYFLAQAYRLNNDKTDIMGSVLLKWLNEDKVRMVKKDKKGLFGSKETTSIELNKKILPLDNDVETELYNMMYEASIDGILEDNEFKKYSKNNYKKVFKWFDNCEENGRELYVKETLVTKNGSKYLIDDKVKNDAIELAGLKKYLKEFAYMNTKQPMEVKLWKEYLMFAQIFGMADEVAKQFEKLYPEIITEMRNSNLDIGDIVMLNHFSRVASVSASSARSAAQNYSSGGGGFSSGGGGGGSFGGGGSGSR